MDEKPAEYFTKRELAERWRCSQRTLDRLIATEGLPYVRVAPRRVIFRIADVERWLAERNANGRPNDLPPAA